MIVQWPPYGQAIVFGKVRNCKHRTSKKKKTAAHQRGRLSMVKSRFGPVRTCGAETSCSAYAATGWRWTYAWRKDSILMALAIFWLPIPYLLGHAEDLHGPRLPLDGIFLTFAAFTILSLVPLAGTNLLQGLKPSFDRDNQE